MMKTDDCINDCQQGRFVDDCLNRSNNGDDEPRICRWNSCVTKTTRLSTYTSRSLCQFRRAKLSSNRDVARRLLSLVVVVEFLLNCYDSNYSNVFYVRGHFASTVVFNTDADYVKPETNLIGLQFVNRIMVPWGPDYIGETATQTKDDTPFRGYGYGIVRFRCDCCCCCRTIF